LARFTTTIDVERPAAEVFAYLEDFSNADEWDPGVAEARRLDDGPVTVGSRFELHLQVGSRTQRWVYTTSEHDAPTRVVFETSSKYAEGRDAIGVVPRGDAACTIQWEATFGFTSLLGRLVDPAFQLVFNRIAGKAVDGLRERMARMEREAA